MPKPRRRSACASTIAASSRPSDRRRPCHAGHTPWLHRGTEESSLARKRLAIYSGARLGIHPYHQIQDGRRTASWQRATNLTSRQDRSDAVQSSGWVEAHDPTPHRRGGETEPPGLTGASAVRLKAL